MSGETEACRAGVIDLNVVWVQWNRVNIEQRRSKFERVKRKTHER